MALTGHCPSLSTAPGQGQPRTSHSFSLNCHDHLGSSVPWGLCLTRRPRAARRVLAQVTVEWSRLRPLGCCSSHLPDLRGRPPSFLPSLCSDGSELRDGHGRGCPEGLAKLGGFAPASSPYWEIPREKGLPRGTGTCCPQDQDIGPLSGPGRWDPGPAWFCGPETAL